MAEADSPTAVEMDKRLWPLVLGNFAVGTGALIVSGLLPAMAGDLGRSVPAMGQAITAFAVAVAIGGPLLAGATSRFDRRNLLQVALLLSAIGHLTCALAPNYAVLLLGRAIAGIGAGLFTPHASTAAAMIAGPERRARAIALVFIGFTASTIAGVPLGTVFGDVIGWRGSLVGIAVVALLALAWLRFSLPTGLYGAPIDAQSWRRIWHAPNLQFMLATTLLQSLGQFVLLTYIAAALVQSIGANGSTIGLLFAVYGVAGVVGNIVGGRLAERFGPGRATAFFVIVTGTGLALFPLGKSNLAGTVAIMLLWGFGAFAINSVQQPRLIGAAPALATATLPLNSSAIYIGQALGAIIGAAIVAGPGMIWLGPAGAAWLALALLASAAAGRADR